MVEFAEAVEAGRVHMVSSIAAAGLYKGTWREDMFEEAENLDNHPYFRTKHDSEGDRPRRSARGRGASTGPGSSSGNSETGEMDKIDGPYYFFKLIRRLRNAVPQWVPMLGVEGREINIVPVDFVARAMDHIAHSGGARRPGLPPHRPEPEDRGRGDRHLRAGRARAAVLGAASRPRVDGRSRRRCVEGGSRSLPPVRPGRRPRPRRLRDPALGPHLHQLPDQLRLAPGPGGARGHRHPGAAARGLRRQALGLLGAPPRPGPVPRPHPGRGRAGAGAGLRQRHHPDHRAADPRRAAAARAAGSRPGLARGRRCAAAS